VVAIAELSEKHFRKTGRPLRIAVDEAGWRFHNISDNLVKTIREKVPAANPIEKAILWRLLRLMRINIQLIFVFDGPARPWKRGGVAGRIDFTKTDLLRKMLGLLEIPHHRAPAEAEAECAWLQQLGVVDAVWSDDSDSLMFGATTLITEYREAQQGRGKAKKDLHLVRVYRADAIKEGLGIDRHGIVLFAVLSGGDYNTKGPPGCGRKAALQAAQFEDGILGRMLCCCPLSLDAASFVHYCIARLLQPEAGRKNTSSAWIPTRSSREELSRTEAFINGSSS